MSAALEIDALCRPTGRHGVHDEGLGFRNEVRVFRVDIVQQVDPVGWQAIYAARIPVDAELAVARLVPRYRRQLAALDVEHDHGQGVDALTDIVQE